MTSTVTVACKHPHGLILRLFRMVDADEPQPGGGTRPVKRSELRHDVAPVKINGYLAHYDVSLPPAARGSEYALTHGVDKEFFDEWMSQNRDHAMVQNQLIFAHESADAIKAVSSANAALQCGLEPINPKMLKGKVKTFDPKEMA